VRGADERTQKDLMERETGFEPVWATIKKASLYWESLTGTH
jgi:hypothetical protein